MLNYNYSEKEIKALLKTMTIIIDTREKNIYHIMEGFHKIKVNTTKKAMTHGDYSFYLPQNEEYGILRDIYFDKKCVIERKNSLTELSQNFAQKRTQFENEMLRSQNTNLILLVEGGSYEDILRQKYKTMLSPASFFSSLLTFENRYGFKTVFIEKQYAFKFIYAHFYYYLREYLRE